MTAKARTLYNQRKIKGTFMAVPTEVLTSHNFLQLSTKAKALVLDIGARFNGYNNGNLAAPYLWMKARGWKSKDTLHRALRELLDAGIIELTRQGGLHGPSLYAFTWWPIHESKLHLDINPTSKASKKWDSASFTSAKSARKKMPPRQSGKTAPLNGLD